MNNYELYTILKREVGTTGTVYYRNTICTRDVYISARIMEFEFDNTTDTLRVGLVCARPFGGYCEQSIGHVAISNVYLPSPMNSRFHGDMIPVRTYFEMVKAEHEQGGFCTITGVRGQKYAAQRYLDNSRFNFSIGNHLKAALEENSVERMSFGFYKPITKADFDYNKIIFSGPCTIIIWKDGTKTMARVSEGDTFDPEKGVAICFMKRILGHTDTNKTLKIADEMWELLNTAYTDMLQEIK